ncbi:hypothetical protein FOZ62_019894 [Perkinsus olseni]|uniref:Integrase catalytic domain-containing protein n=1 Tax=Perkinsus olseni TaxID=32597 RepID=A0A7J6QND5_PEROL|nr:hypothetical protein FOZ62_019894 [Perkinsus olseni]
MKLSKASAVSLGLTGFDAKVFTATSLKTYLASYGVHITHIPPYAPFYGGWYERVHASLASTLRRLLLDYPQDWLTFVPEVQWILNHIEHSEYGATAHELLFGYRDNDHWLYLTDANTDHITDQQQQQDVHRHFDRHKALLTHFTRIWEEEHPQTRRALLSRHLTSHPYHVGDLVCRYRARPTKLSTGWSGPFKIVDRVTDVIYKIAPPGEEDSLVEHARNLAPSTANPSNSGHNIVENGPGQADDVEQDDNLRPPPSVYGDDDVPQDQRDDDVDGDDLPRGHRADDPRTQVKLGDVALYRSHGEVLVGEVLQRLPADRLLVQVLRSDAQGSWLPVWIHNETAEETVATIRPTGADPVIMDIPKPTPLITITLTTTRGLTRKAKRTLETFSI